MRCLAIEAALMFAAGLCAGIAIDHTIHEKMCIVNNSDRETVKKKRSVELMDGKVIFNLRRK